MNVTGGATDVTTYFVLRTAADGTAKTGATIADIDLQYIRTGESPSAKVDAVELATINGAHEDNKVKEVDSTDAPGLYRVDWPDAAFAAGVKQVILTVKLATCFTEHMAVDIDAPVNTTKLNGTAQTGRDIGASVLLSSGSDPGQLDFTSGVVKSDLTQILGTAQRATDLAEIAQYLFANEATLTSVLADNSVLAQLLATDGDISEYSKTTDALQSLRDAISEIRASMPSTSVATFGQMLAGSQTDTWAKTTATDSDYWIVSPPDNANPLDCALVFEAPSGSSPVRVDVLGYFDAAPNRYVNIWLNDFSHANAVADDAATATDVNPSVITASVAGSYAGLTLDGLPLYIDSGTNVTQGFYTIASNTDDTITLTSNCCSGGAGSDIHMNVIVWERMTSNESAMENASSSANYSVAVHARHICASGVHVIVRFTDSSDTVFSTGYELKLDYVTFTSQGATGTVCDIGLIVDAVINGSVANADIPHTLGSISRASRLVETSVATADSTTSFTLADGPAVADAYVGATITIEDKDSIVMANDHHHREARIITGWTDGRVVTVDSAFGFTPAVGDIVFVWPDYSRQTGDSYGRLGAPASASVSADIAAVKTVADTIAGDVENIDGEAMRGTDDANTVVPDVAGTAAALHTTTDAAIATRSSHDAAAVWAVGTRTLSSFGTLLADIWAYATRTLTGGGDATEAKQNTIIANLSTLRGADNDTLKTLSDQLDSVGGQTGSGADTVTLIITDGDDNPIADVDVWLTSDEDGDTVVAGTKQTDAAGEVEFMLDAGTTYYRWAQKSGYNFTNPTSFVAVAD